MGVLIPVFWGFWQTFYLHRHATIGTPFPDWIHAECRPQYLEVTDSVLKIKPKLTSFKDFNATERNFEEKLEHKYKRDAQTATPNNLMHGTPGKHDVFFHANLIWSVYCLKLLANMTCFSTQTWYGQFIAWNPWQTYVFPRKHDGKFIA